MAQCNTHTKLAQCFELIENEAFLPALEGLPAIEVWRNIMTENAIMELVCPIQTFCMNVIRYINWKLIIHKPKFYRFTKFHQMLVKGYP